MWRHIASMRITTSRCSKPTTMSAATRTRLTSNSTASGTPSTRAFIVFQRLDVSELHRAARRTGRRIAADDDEFQRPRRPVRPGIQRPFAEYAVCSASQPAAAKLLSNAGRHPAIQSRGAADRHRARRRDNRRRIPVQHGYSRGVCRALPVADGRGDLVLPDRERSPSFRFGSSSTSTTITACSMCFGGRRGALSKGVHGPMCKR